MKKLYELAKIHHDLTTPKDNKMSISESFDDGFVITYHNEGILIKDRYANGTLVTQEEFVGRRLVKRTVFENNRYFTVFDTSEIKICREVIILDNGSIKTRYKKYDKVTEETEVIEDIDRIVTFHKTIDSFGKVEVYKAK